MGSVNRNSIDTRQYISKRSVMMKFGLVATILLFSMVINLVEMADNHGTCACEVYQGTKTRTIWEKCHSGYRPVRWWQIFHNCHCRCCPKSLEYVAAGTSEGDAWCGEWTSRR